MKCYSFIWLDSILSAEIGRQAEKEVGDRDQWIETRWRVHESDQTTWLIDSILSQIYSDHNN